MAAPDVLLSAVCRYLGKSKHSVSVDSELANGVIKEVQRSKALKGTGVELTFDLIDPLSGTWQVVATTDRSRPTGIHHKSHDGVVGWALRHARYSAVFLADPSTFPSDMRLVDGFNDIHSAYVQLIRKDGTPVACLCAVARESTNGMASLVPTLDKCSRILEVAATAGRYRPQPVAELRLPRAPFGEDFANWIQIQLSSLAPARAVYWQFDGVTGLLNPIQVQSDTSRSSTLTPLKTDEGFAGSAAARNAEIYEPRVNGGVGETTGITTPLGEIYPGRLLRSIVSLPVTDDYRLHGVVTVLGETPEEFDDADLVAFRTLSKHIASQLQDRDDRFLAGLRKRALEDLEEAIHAPDTPTEFWQRVSTVFEKLREASLVKFIALLVARRDLPTRLTCKASSANLPSFLVGPWDLGRDSWLRQPFKEASRDLRFVPVNRIRSGEIAVGILGLGGSGVWVEKYPPEATNPTFIALAGRPRGTVLTPPFGKRDVSETVEAVFRSTFYNAKAVLTASDWKTLSDRQSLLVASELHDIRHPLVSLRHTAEEMTGLDRENMSKRGRIISQADALLLRVESTLFLSRSQKIEPREQIDLPGFVNEVVEQLRKSHAEASFRVSMVDTRSDYHVKGSTQWLRVACRHVLHNAVKFGRGSPVVVTLTYLIEDDEAWGSIVVMDRGIGIPDAEREKIFVAGHRNPHSRAYVVTGAQVGLSISRDIIQGHGGKIWAHSKVGEWTEIHIHLPIHLGVSS